MSTSSPNTLASYGFVLEHLQQECQTRRPGARLPPLTELRKQLNASERSVLKALEELQRQGLIVRRQGSGTYIAESTTPEKASFADSNTIVAIRTPDNSYFDRCVDVLFNHVEQAGLSLLCQIVRAGALPDVESLPGLSGARGILLFSQRLAPLARQLQAKGVSTVLVGAPLVDTVPEVPSVFADHVLGGMLVTRHLLEQGHRRIAFQVVEHGLMTMRWQGHQKALQEAREQGCALEATQISSEVFLRWQEHPDELATFFRRPDAPTAIVAWNDHEAALLMAALHSAGIRVPDDVSLTGYDALPEGELVRPRLTTVDHALDWQLRMALALLCHPTFPTVVHSHIAVPTLVRGDSVAPPNK